MQSKNHWEEVFWWLLAANFGIKVNTLLFEEVAKSISINILAKHKQQIHQLEALLMGQANLLNGKMEEEYPLMLQKEYTYLRKKHALTTITIQPNFLRLRPANFPTVRLAQLAMLIQQSSHLFSHIKELNSFKEVETLLSVQANDYWHYHYRFNKTTSFMPKILGTETINNILINTIAPILFAYGTYNNNELYQEKAIRWLIEAKPEVNSLIQGWQDYGLKAKSAFDSQALIELTNNYCYQKRCLECTVGNKILQGLKD